MTGNGKRALRINSDVFLNLAISDQRTLSYDAGSASTILES